MIVVCGDYYGDDDDEETTNIKAKKLTKQFSSHSN